MGDSNNFIKLNKEINGKLIKTLAISFILFALIITGALVNLIPKSQSSLTYETLQEVVDENVDLSAASEVTFPTSWQTEINSTTYINKNGISPISTTAINSIVFDSVVPTGFTSSHYAGNLSTGINVYIKASSTSGLYDVAFVSGGIIKAPQDSSYLFSNSASANRLKKLTSITFTNFDTSSVSDMSYMFVFCSGLTSLDVSEWDVSNVENITGVFCSCSKLTSLDVSKWSTGNIMLMGTMFYGCSKLMSLDVSEWDTSNAYNMSNMFYGCSELTSLNVSNFKTSNVTNMVGMFYDCYGLTSLDLSKWDTGNVIYMNNMFYNCYGLKSLDVSEWDTSSVTYIQSMFKECNGLTSLNVSNFKTSNVTNMREMFYNCYGLKSLDVSKWDTSNVTDMQSMFNECFGLTSLNVSNFKTSNVTNMREMFYDCYGLTSLDVSKWDTAKVTNMYSMFESCSRLTSLDVSEWDTSKVEDMTFIFSGCSKLTSLDVSNFNTAKVINMGGMFSWTDLTSLDLSKWDTSSVTTMFDMFNNCSGLTTLDLSSFDMTKVTDASDMFTNCSALKYITLPTAINSSLTVTLPNNGTWYKTNGAVLTDSKLIAKTATVTDAAIGYKVTANGNDTDANPAIITGSGWTIASDNRIATIVVRYSVNSSGELINSSSITLPTATRSGYMFNGWYKEAAGTNFVGNAGASYTPTANITLYAKWTQNNVTFPTSWQTEINSATYINKNSISPISATAINSIVFDSVVPTGFTSSHYAGNLSTGINVYIKSSSTSGLYDVAFVSSATIMAPQNSRYLFSNSSSENRLTNLTSITFTNFNTSSVTNMSSMFYDCSGLTILDLSGFNTSNITGSTSYGDFVNMFNGCSGLIQINGIADWNTSQVKYMGGMFANCSSLNSLDISKWDTGNVIYMISMFQNCTGLATLDISKWKTGNVTAMSNMFYDCSGLTSLDVSEWDTSNVEYMAHMFYGCRGLTSLDVSKWDTGNVIGMSGMFSDCSGLTSLDVSEWDTSNVEYMAHMFYGCRGLTSLDVSNFTTTNVADMQSMFHDCRGLTSLDVSKWNTANVTNMLAMFYVCSGLTSLDISNFDMTKVTNASIMFDYCSALKYITLPTAINSSLTVTLPNNGTWYKTNGAVLTDRKLIAKTSTITDAAIGYTVTANGNDTDANPAIITGSGWTIASDNRSAAIIARYSVNSSGELINPSSITLPTATRTGYDLSGWYTEATSGTKVGDAGASYLPSADSTIYAQWTANSVKFPTTWQDEIADTTSGIGVKANKLTSIIFEFEGSTRLNSYADTGRTLSTGIKIYKKTGSNDIAFVSAGEIYVEGSCYYLFSDYSSQENRLEMLTSIEFINFNTSKARNMESMFEGGIALEELDLNAFNTENVVNMNRLFYGCSALKRLNITTFNTAKVEQMREMFYNCNSLSSVNLSSFDTKNVNTMKGMFYLCNSLKTLDLSLFTTTKVTDMTAMFGCCDNLESLDLSNFNTSQVDNMASLFYSCAKLNSLNILNFNTEKVTNMYSMFSGCSSLSSLNITSFDTKIVQNMDYMFNFCNGLKYIDLSSFDMTSVTSANSMISTNTKFIKLPIAINQDLVVELKYVTWCKTDGSILTYNKLIAAEGENVDISMAYKLTANGNDTDANPATITGTGWTINSDNRSAIKATRYTVNTSGELINPSSITLPSATRTGYTFNGWYKDAAGSNFVGNAGASYSPSADVTLYANWAINSYKLTINPNGGSYEGSSSNKTIIQEYNTTYTVANPTREGYTFTGWILTRTIGSGSAFGSLSGNEYTFGGGDDILTAQWDTGSYTLTINPNGGSYEASTENKIVTQEYNTTYILVNPTREGYTFTGWTLTRTIGSGSAFGSLSGNEYTFGDGNDTLTANWDIDTYTITYTLNGGTVNPLNPAQYNIETDDIILNNPTKSGHTFAGWTGTDLSSITKNVTIEKGSAGNRVYIANWIVNPTKPTAIDNLKYSGLLQLGVENIESDYFTLESGSIQEINAGNYTATFKLIDGFKWNDDSSEDAVVEWSIAKKDLIITAEDKSIEYGQNAPQYTFTAIGFVNNEDASVLVGEIAYEIKNSNYETILITNTTPVGSYVIIPSGLSSDNYEIEYENGTLSISNVKANITLSKNSSIVQYGDTDNFEISYDGDGELVVTSSNNSLVTVNRNDTQVLLKVIAYDNTNVNISVSATAGVNYGAPDSKIFVVTLAKREICFKSLDDSKKYDGSALTNNSASVNSGSLANFDDTIDTVTFDFSGTITDFGRCDNEFTATIKRNNQDISNYYDIEYMFGKLSILKADLDAPSNLIVDSYGKVTFDTVTGATGYEISVNNSNFISCVNNGNYSDLITSTAGERTVKVKAISDNINYQNSGEIASISVMVYTLTVNKDNGITTELNTGNYISGRTIDLNINVGDKEEFINWVVYGDGNIPVDINNSNTTITITKNTIVTAKLKVVAENSPIILILIASIGGLIVVIGVTTIAIVVHKKQKRKKKFNRIIINR